MVKFVFAAATAFTLFSVGVAATSPANAGGGSTSAVKRTNSALVASNRTAITGRNRSTEITEFSSSSARRHRRTQ